MSDIRYTKEKGVLGGAFHLLERGFAAVFRAINGAGEGEMTWDKLWPPQILGLANLLGLRIGYRRDNLFDTDGDLTQAKSDFSADFVADDLIHPLALLVKLRTGGDCIAAHLWAGISDNRRKLLQTFEQKATAANSTYEKPNVTRAERDPQSTALWQLRSTLSAELNKVVAGKFCHEPFIEGIAEKLSSQTATFRQNKPVGEDREWLNRWILEDIYAYELRRNRDRVRVCPFHAGPRSTHKRTEDGTMNDLRQPAMGCRFSRLGRNMQSKKPVNESPGLLHPNPLLISEELLARKGRFKPASGLNLLAGAWIQFEVHDWFSHELEHQEAGKDIRVPKAGDWPPTDAKAAKLIPSSGEMVLPQTKPDPTNSYPLNARHPAFRNKDPQWWDASQIYGESVAETLRLRFDPNAQQLCPHGKLFLDKNGLLPHDEGDHVLSGFTDNWWLGIEILHTLFVKEHNYICDRLVENEPHLTDQEIFEVARLVNSALMAKIHTVEWTPGIIAHEAIEPALNINWRGVIGYLAGKILGWFMGKACAAARGEKLARAVAPWIPTDTLKDILTGTPLSEPDHHGAPYSLTEEFNAVYRLHPLLPDIVHLRKSGADSRQQSFPTPQVAFGETRNAVKAGFTMDDLVYSFGVEHPGAITIGNYPDFLRQIILPADQENGRMEEQVMDLGAVDIIRDRERGVPRYNEFRRSLNMKPKMTFMDMTGCKETDAEKKELADKLEKIYGKVELVDNMVGMFCEKNPKNFGFSDTAFRIFILMASRRLKSDRFFTSCYTKEYYTKTGLDHIAATGLREIIVRHHKNLAAHIPPGNPFAAWKGPQPA